MQLQDSWYPSTSKWDKQLSLFAGEFKGSVMKRWKSFKKMLVFIAQKWEQITRKVHLNKLWVHEDRI